MTIQTFFTNRTFSVSEFNRFLNDLFRPLEATIEGEVSEWNLSRDRFIWFTLKDEKESLRCFALKHTIRVPVEVGMKVKIVGYPKIFGKSGNFSLFVQRLELSGEGSLKRAYELLKEKLQAEGIFEVSRKRPLPAYPKTLGLITAGQSAAFTDFVTHIQARMGGLRLVFVPVAVQGRQAVSEILSAFDYFRNHQTDVVVLTRGGGGLEDLQAFNSEEVVRAIFSCPIPTICAIGHERDIALAELAADARASTPTHAAQLAVSDRQVLIQKTDLEITQQEQALRRLSGNLANRLDSGRRGLESAIAGRMEQIKQSLQVFLSTFERIVERQARLSLRQDALAKLIRSLSPKNILSRGYSIVYKSGKIIKSAQSIDIGDNLDITMSKGTIKTSVAEIHP